MKNCPLSVFLLLLNTIFLHRHHVLMAPLSAEVCSMSTPVARKFFVLDQFVFLSENADNFDTYRLLNLSSGAITSRHPGSDFSSQMQESLTWAFMLDVAEGRCASEPLDSPYCTRVDDYRNLIVVRGASRQLIFMRLQGSGSDVSLVAVEDVNSNFIEMQVLVKHLDKFGYVSSLTFNQKEDHYVSTHFGLIRHLCLTNIRHRGQTVALPFPDEVLNENIFSTKCLPSPAAYNSVIDLEGQLFGSTSLGTVDRLVRSGEHFQAVETLTDKAFLNCSSLVQSRSVGDTVGNPEVKRSNTNGSLLGILFTVILVYVAFGIGFACYVGDQTVAGSVKDAFEGAKSWVSGEKRKTPKNGHSQTQGRKGKPSEAGSRSSSKKGDSKRNNTTGGADGGRGSQKKTDSKVVAKELALAASNGIAQTFKSLRVFGQQLSHRLSQWKTPLMAAPSGTSRAHFTSDASSLWGQSSVSVTPLTDDTENGGIDLATSTASSDSYLSTGTTISEMAEDDTSESDRSYQEDNPSIDSDSEEESPTSKGTDELGLSSESSELLTTTNSSYLSTEKELTETNTELTRTRTGSLSLTLPILQSVPSTEKKKKVTSVLESTVEGTRTLSQTISHMLDQFRKDRPEKNAKLAPLQEEGGHRSGSPTPSTSPSLPPLLKPGQFDKLTSARSGSPVLDQLVSSTPVKDDPSCSAN